ncbi:aspartate aminotransferase [Carboxydocella sporoproducens DSM 16521]|uniref:Aminotransferase n=2 Tax=Carboxydocella TaxID=178898 RepID=A0A1T4MEG3_9FIRM|nr:MULTISPECIES: pyridoxal phosphate-dependent aminotransferase [Carboxydocella]AVX21290.1 aspartate aminotransferase [Carboxydocella thermautotrophica]AVX31722.1 aspartate aminotransferase [Carboxydocella thermautotrophica]SJZ65332.1 aspartate aminotransferase [Carboxydocella sporoproducens DSM 16521]
MELAERALRISPSPTLALDSKAKAMARAGAKVINFGVGEPDFDTPEHIKTAAMRAIERGMTKYTAVAGIEELKEAIVTKLAQENGLLYSPAQVVVSCGAKHSLYNALQVIINPGDEVLMPVPYWVSYEEQIKLAGGVPVPVPASRENNYKVRVEDLERAITGRTKALILNSPNNPTGAVYSREELESIGKWLLERGLAVISDEIYEKLVYDGNQHHSIVAVVPELSGQAIVINGVSKAYAMTGWRIGYAAAPLPWAKAMADLQSHCTSNPTSIAQAAALAALTGPQQPLQEMVAAFDRRRQRGWELLQQIPGIYCSRPAGAFYLFPDVSGVLGKSWQGRPIESSAQLAELLLEEVQVAAVPGEAFGQPGTMRLSYAVSLEVLEEGIRRIGQLISEVK